MTNITDTTRQTWLQRFKKARRKKVKIWGRSLTRSLANFLGRQSLVGDTPVLDFEAFSVPRQLHRKLAADQRRGDRDTEASGSDPGFQDISLDQIKISKGNNWRTFILFGFGNKLEKNCKQAPVTTRLLEAVPNLQTAWFSILGPGYHIPAHRGVSKGILRAHLGLIIPKEAEKCRMRVGDTINVWRPGEIFVFDDTYEHEVWNDTDGRSAYPAL